MKPPEHIETKRLVLRIPTLTGAAPIFNSYAQDTEVTRYLTWQPHMNVQETKGFLSDCIAAWHGDT